MRGFCWYLFSLLITLMTIASVTTSIITRVKTYESSLVQCQCQNGTNGLPGQNDSCICCPDSDPHFSTQSINTIIGSAQYFNNRRSPGNNARSNGQPIRMDSATYNNLPLDIRDFYNNQGTIFNLSIGTYELVYGLSITGPGSLCLYNGSSLVGMNPLLESMVGSSVSQVWLHGNYIMRCNSIPCYVKLAPYNSSTLTVAVSPTFGVNTGAMVQMSILKLY